MAAGDGGRRRRRKNLSSRRGKAQAARPPVKEMSPGGGDNQGPISATLVPRPQKCLAMLKRHARHVACRVIIAAPASFLTTLCNALQCGQLNGSSQMLPRDTLTERRSLWRSDTRLTIPTALPPRRHPANSVWRAEPAFRRCAMGCQKIRWRSVLIVAHGS